MKFNIAFLGPDHIFHLRRDFILVLKYALESAGHDVVLSGPTLEANRFNLIIGAYFQKTEAIQSIEKSGIKYAHVNTEVVAEDMLNFDPDKVDFMGAYLPSMKAGEFVWDVIMNNMTEYERYGANAHFLRWGSHEKMKDIERNRSKDLDFYFFGLLSNRRRKIIASLQKAGLKGVADHFCPYFVRNDRISRAKVQLNIIQEDKYTHVNSFRICFLADNGVAILSEREKDPAGYLDYAIVTNKDELLDAVQALLVNDEWKKRGEEAEARFEQIKMKDVMEELLEKSFSNNG